MKIIQIVLCCLILNPMQAHAQSLTPISGYEFLGKDIQEIQDDEFLNPGMPTVELGSQIFREAEEGEKACASCHGEEGELLDKNNIASYPAYQPVYKIVHTLQERIHACSVCTVL